MINNEIEVYFRYEGEQEQNYKYKENEKIKDICVDYASKKGIIFDCVHFLFQGNVLQLSDYDKPLNYFISKLKLKGQNYTMIDDGEDTRSISNAPDSTLGKIFGYFFND